MFPTFSKDVDATRNLLSQLPPAVRAALDISLEQFFTIYGFFAYLLTFVSLAAATQSMGLGVSALSKEEHGKTADFLLSKPVSRTKILTSKLFAALTALLGTNLVFTGATFAMANFITHGEASTQTLLRLCSTVLIIQLAFFCFGFLLSAVLPKVKSIVAVSLPTVFVFFIIGTLGAIIGNSAVRYLTPFKYYDLIALIDTGKYDTKSLLLEGALCCFSILPDHNYSASKTAEQHT